MLTKGEVPQILKNANIVTILKKKGDKAVCGNIRSISFLSVAGKMVTKIMLSRLICQVTEQHLPERQCGFREDRSTSNMISCLQQLQEKAREQNKDLFVAFIDHTKAFDAGNRPMLWTLTKNRDPPRFSDHLEINA